MARLDTLIIAFLGALVVSSSAEVIVKTRPVIWQGSSPVVNNDIKPKERSVSETEAKSTNNKLEAREPVIDCLFPSSGAAVPEDCADLCEFFRTQEGLYYEVPSNDLIEFDTGTCGLGATNLDMCRDSQLVSASTFASVCDAMTSACVVNGYDAIAQDSDARLAWAIYGLDAPPAYPSPSAC